MLAALQEMHQLQQQFEVLKQCQSLQVELNKMIELKKLRDENIAKMQIQPCNVNILRVHVSATHGSKDDFWL